MNHQPLEVWDAQDRAVLRQEPASACWALVGARVRAYLEADVQMARGDQDAVITYAWAMLSLLQAAEHMAINPSIAPGDLLLLNQRASMSDWAGRPGARACRS